VIGPTFYAETDAKISLDSVREASISPMADLIYSNCTVKRAGLRKKLFLDMASKPNDTGTSSKGMSIYTQKNKDTVEEISSQQPKKRKANPQSKECNAQVKSPI
jgi:hypothetical protein